MDTEYETWPTCLHCQAPLAGLRSNQHYCDKECKRKAAYQRRKQAAVTEVPVALPTYAESTLAAYLTWSAQDVKEVLSLLRTMLSREQYANIYGRLNKVVRRASDKDAVRIHQIDLAEAARDYQAFVERTELFF